MKSPEKRIDLLDNILKQVNDWLKFAEAKNGALIAVGCATIFGAFRVFSSITETNNYIEIYSYLFIIMTSAAVIISLMSFIPRLEPPFWIRLPEKKESDNPFFFGDACKYSKGSYLDLFNKHSGFTVENSLEIESAISDQIVNNSKIAFIKYKMFTSSIYLFLAGILTPVGALIVYWLRE